MCSEEQTARELVFWADTLTAVFRTCSVADPSVRSEFFDVDPKAAAARENFALGDAREEMEYLVALDLVIFRGRRRHHISPTEEAIPNLRL